MACKEAIRAFLEYLKDHIDELWNKQIDKLGRVPPCDKWNRASGGEGSDGLIPVAFAANAIAGVLGETVS